MDEIKKVLSKKLNIVSGLVLISFVLAAYLAWVSVPRYVFIYGTFTNMQPERLFNEDGYTINSTSTPHYYLMEFEVDGQKAEVEQVVIDSESTFAVPVRLSRRFGEINIPFTLMWYSPVQDKAWRFSETFSFDSRSIKKSLVGNELGLMIYLNEQNYVRVSPIKYTPPNLMQQINSIGVTTGAQGHDVLIRNQQVNVVELSRQETEAIKVKLELMGN